ncbi:lonely Cys domain-containing protein, partial [Streptomyces sp. SID7804]|uniref:lonely Cys domain-containing protein n=1 Tax=Streptomyces sp. SID7804 TaxID=2690327 RepID=UPI0031F66DD0
MAADSRYAGDGFRDAVRRVAGHLLGEWTGTGAVPSSAAELADTLRTGLGLHPRWTTPATDVTADDADTAAPARTGPEPEAAAAPVPQSGTGADLPDLDMTDIDTVDTIDMSMLDNLDLSVFDGIDLAGFDFDFGFDGDGFDVDLGLGTSGPGAPDAPDQDVTDADAADTDMADADPTAPGLTDHDPTTHDPTTHDPSAPEPTAVDTGGGQQVFAAPTAAASSGRPLAPLPRLSLVQFDQGRTTPSSDAQQAVERLAFRVARAGLRNRRVRVPLPKVDIAGFGADGRQEGTAQVREQAARQRGDQRARTAHDLFVRKLDHALRTLQQNVPQDRPRLTARDFRITSRGRARVPGQGVTVGSSQQVSRADLGRQATIAVTSTGHAAAVETLDALRRADRTLRTGPLDVEAVARRVLHLEPFVLVDPEMRKDLYAMVERATAAGRADSLAALTAFHLDEAGVLAADRARYVTVGGTRVPGLNWDGSDTVELDSIFVEILTPDPSGGFVPSGTSDFAPWAWDVTPYVVLADGRHDTVTARLPDGTTQDLDADEFAELVAADPELRGMIAGAPIVLAVPFAGDRYLDLPRKLAERTGRTVWVHSGLARRHPDPASAQSTIAVIHKDGLPHGSWLPVRPGLAPDADDDAPAWHRDVLSQPVVSTLTGQQIGRSLHDPSELPAREEHFAALDRMTQFVHFNPATGTYSAKLPLTDPGPKDKAYHLAGHGLPGGLTMPLSGGGSRTADRREAGEWLRRRKSLTGRPADHWVDMVVCYSSAPQDGAVQDLSQVGHSFPVPFAADPVDDDAVSLGQYLANTTGRTVRVSYALQGAFRYQDDPVRVLFTDERGRRWWWETSRPEPGEAELDRLATLAGIEGEPTPRTRAELLRVVRTLRLVLGPDVEDAADYPTLVLGAAAIDNMWHVDPDLGPTGPFSPDLLRRVVAAHPQAASGVDRQATRRVLAAAAQTWWSGARPAVSRFVQLPVPLSAAGWLRDTAAVEAAAVAALKLAGPDEVGAAVRARMFWARVKAEETLRAAGPDADAFTAKVLHLDPAVEVDDTLRGEALTLLTRGFAAGRDMADGNVAAAYDLEARGAFDGSAASTTMGSELGGGRDWKDGTAFLPALERFRVADAVVDAPWAGQDASGKDKPVPYLVRASVDLQDGNLLHVAFGGASYQVSAAEFAELLAADTSLRRKDLTTPVLLELDGFDGPAPGVADVIAQRLGRGVWWSRFPVELSGTDDEGTPVPTLVSSLTTLTGPTAADWQEARPVDQGGTQEGHRPVDPPLPAAPRPDTGAGGVSTAGDGTASGAPAKPRSSAGDPMEGVEMTSVPVPTGPASTTPVFTSPAAPPSVRPLPALPPRGLVAYDPGKTAPSRSGEETLERLASQVAAAGLRNRRAGAALPRLSITGYGADARRGDGAQTAEQSATARR